MSKKEQEQVKEEELQQEETQTEAQNAEVESQNAEEEQPAKEETPEDKIAALQAELEKSQKEYLFLMAEFDNYRKRTVKEKAELIKNGGEKAMLGLLPVIDDFERAIDAIDKSSDVEGLKEGVDLIYNKFMKYLESQQVKPMESTGTDFDADIYEAVTTFPAPDESMKGKVIDTVQKGYTINEKVLRHAKVVVGQ
ncbi:MAG: nucleotide exchange factor GrpE [Sodaliphilus sp.]|nr:nucleotide exchange factor GrpE [Muribaculaceae bacterium]MCI6079332.1 nucleotide exchange factor GrpE [Bacteroidales bacterium]MDY2592631.1 nucleotide exchange factor GrpE [Sodaliphilus sp.]MCI6225329.1 nucleotide exchange factor GrpE [Bacteroidales bacterium]MCI6294106.1 nucleotide exchange factor GrpE [Bacteroidales bacterium]